MPLLREMNTNNLNKTRSRAAVLLLPITSGDACDMEVEIRTSIYRGRPLLGSETYAASVVSSPDSTGQAPAYVHRPSSTEEPGVELGHSEGVLGAKCLPKAGQCHLLFMMIPTGCFQGCADGLP